MRIAAPLLRAPSHGVLTSYAFVTRSGDLVSRICPTVSLRRARLAIALPASLPVTVVREPRIRKKKKERKKHGPESRVRWNEAHRPCIVVRNVEGGGPVRPRDSVYIASSRWRATARGPKCNVVPRHATDPYARGA